jgi:hypothetical protein
MMRRLHKTRTANSMYICTQTEIKYGQLDKQDWDASYIQLTQRNEFSISFLAKEILPKFLNSKLGFALINILHMREEDGLAGTTGINGQKMPHTAKGLRTVAYGITEKDESFWFEMFKVLSEELPLGMVISDMSVPGCPLVHLNKAFSDLTGYEKDKIGTNCKFLQGIDSEPYLIEDIMLSLQQSEPLLIKISNYKIDGTKFQCLLALQPIFGWKNEYKYQIGIQIEFESDKNMQEQLLLLDCVLYNIPRSSSGEDMFDILRIIPTDVMGDSTVQPSVTLSKQTEWRGDKASRGYGPADGRGLRKLYSVSEMGEESDGGEDALEPVADYDCRDNEEKDCTKQEYKVDIDIDKEKEIDKDGQGEREGAPVHAPPLGGEPTERLADLVNFKDSGKDQKSSRSDPEAPLTGRKSEKDNSVPTTPTAGEYNYNATNASFTKIMWLQNSVQTLRNILSNPDLRKFFVKFVEDFGSLLMATCLDFLLQSMEIENTMHGVKQIKLLRSFCMNNKRNGMFYFSADMNYGEFKSTDWYAILREISIRKRETEDILVTDCFPRFLDHSLSVELINIVHQSKSTAPPSSDPNATTFHKHTLPNPNPHLHRSHHTIAHFIIITGTIGAPIDVIISF